MLITQCGSLHCVILTIVLLCLVIDRHRGRNTVSMHSADDTQLLPELLTIANRSRERIFVSIHPTDVTQLLPVASDGHQ